MNLLGISIGTDSGLTIEQNYNANVSVIDGHNHTSGSGVQIPPAGLNINAALTFNNQSATNLQSVVFTPQTSLSTLDALYVIGGDLYYNDGSSNVIQMTAGGSVNATSSGIASGSATASFVSSVLVVNAAANTPANIQVGSVLLGNNSAGSHYLTLSPPSAMAADFSLTLPSIPAAQQFLSIDTSGNIAGYANVSGGIQTSNIASQAITTALIADQNVTTIKIADGSVTPAKLSGPTAATSSSQTVTISSGSYVDVGTLSASMTTVRGARIYLVPHSNGTSPGAMTVQNSGTTIGSYLANISLLKDGTQIATWQVGGYSQSSSVLGACFPPLSTVYFEDFNSPGAHTYKLQALVTGAAASITFTNCHLFVEEVS